MGMPGLLGDNYLNKHFRYPLFNIISSRFETNKLILPASETLSKNSRYGLAYIRVLIRSHNQKLVK